MLFLLLLYFKKNCKSKKKKKKKICVVGDVDLLYNIPTKTEVMICVKGDANV